MGGDVEASMMAAYINADEERLRKKEMEETMAEAKTKADKEDHKAAVHEEHKAPKGPIAAIHAEAGLISDVSPIASSRRIRNGAWSGPQMAPCHGRRGKSWIVISFAQRLSNFRNPSR